MAAASNNKKPIEDIAKPGNTPADATSRPVIIGRGPVMRDPMVNDENEPSQMEPEAEKPPLPTTKKVIKPVESDESPAQTEDNPDESEPSKGKPESDTKPSDESSADKPAETDDEVSDTAVVDAVLDQVDDKKEQTAEDKAAEERQNLVNKLVAEKKYFLPLAAAQHRRNNRIMLIVLVALLPLIVGVVLAVDAGILDIGISLPFDLIKQ